LASLKPSKRREIENGSTSEARVSAITQPN
jgi:hypothetical protein